MGVKKIVKCALIVCGAFFFMQIPLFMQQYQHQLIGHVAELKWQIEGMKRQAQFSKKTLAEYITKFEQSNDEDVASQGGIMKKVETRWINNSTALAKLQKSSPFTRFFVFVRYVDKEIAEATFKEFAWGLSFTQESLLYASIGILMLALLLA